MKIYQTIGNYYDEMGYRRRNNTFQFEEDQFSRNVEGLSKIYHELLLLNRFLQTKPQVMSMNFFYFDFYYTLNENRNELEIANVE